MPPELTQPLPPSMWTVWPAARVVLPWVVRLREPPSRLWVEVRKVMPDTVSDPGPFRVPPDMFSALVDTRMLTPSPPADTVMDPA